MAERTPYRESNPAALSIPLRSDPPWLRAGLLAVTLGAVALCTLYFALVTPRPPLTLALLPGLAVATFAGAWLAWWGRRRGGSLALESTSARLVLREPHRREELVDRAVPFGAVVVRDASTRRSVLVLSQGGEPVMLLDTGPVAAPTDTWQARTVEVDLSGVALSPASAHVLTVAIHRSIDPLLDALAHDLTDTSPLLTYPLPSGEVLLVRRDEVRLGGKVVPVGAGTTTRRTVIQYTQGGVAACALTAGETTLRLACQATGEENDGTTASEAPDAHLPPVVFAVVCALFGLSPGKAPREDTALGPPRGV
jgi:hypothetical protein